MYGKLCRKACERFFSSQEGLLKLLQDEFDFTKWLLTKQDNKMVVIRRPNVMVNWYKLTKIEQLQGSNDQVVKRLTLSAAPLKSKSQRQSH